MRMEKCEVCGEEATCHVWEKSGYKHLCIEHYRTPYKKG